MASSYQRDQKGNARPSRGPARLIVVGNLENMIEAAETNPHMAKALINLATMAEKQEEVRTGSVEEDVDLGPALETWKEAMRFEANRDGAEEAFERELADELAATKLEKEPVATQNTAASGTKSFAGSTTGQSSSSASARGAGLDKVASRWVRALGEAEHSKEDQMDDPGSENPATAAEGITTAQILHDAVFADKIPTDPLTRDHFGFSKVNSYEEESCLLGLYQGLLMHLPLRRPTLETVQGWQRKNKLAGGIYYCYKCQDAESGYFDWFKKNQDFLSQDYKRPEGPWTPVERPTSVDEQKLQATIYPKRSKKRSKP